MKLTSKRNFFFGLESPAAVASELNNAITEAAAAAAARVASI